MKKALIVILLSLSAVVSRAATPETVVVTFHPNPGNEARMEAVIRKEWAILLRLHAVVPDSSRLFRVEDEAVQHSFIHIMTWRDATIPDKAPSEVTRVWDEMHALGKVNFVVVTPLRN